MLKLLLLIPLLLKSEIGPYVNGHFYPKESKDIKNFISEAFNKIINYKTTTKFIGAIVPHAGYIYSGTIAAYVYKIIPKADVYFIIAPSHRYWIDKLVMCDENFKTPLGNIEVEKDIVKSLSKNDPFSLDCSKFVGEHAIEVQLPFLQYRFKDSFKIVPILVNTQDTKTLNDAAKLIKKISDENKKNIFYIVSSDLSHYPEYDKAKILDLTLIESIKHMDSFYLDLTSKLLLSKNIENYQTSACGLAGIMLGIELSKLYGANMYENIIYKNSYDTNPKMAEKKSVVGYTAGFFTISKETKKEFYSDEEKKLLLHEARKSIEDFFNKKDINNEISKNIKFNLPKAVFVTLTQNGNLRGCMGTTEPRDTLLNAVRYFARVSAFGDPRFSSLKEDELTKTKIEISILSPLRKVSNYTEVKEKKDGVVIVSKRGSGLFLPQVWDYFPNKESFLTELCTQKAGLEPNCYKSKEVDIFVFDVEKFSE